MRAPDPRRRAGRARWRWARPGGCARWRRAAHCRWRPCGCWCWTRPTSCGRPTASGPTSSGWPPRCRAASRRARMRGSAVAPLAAAHAGQAPDPGQHLPFGGRAARLRMPGCGGWRMHVPARRTSAVPADRDLARSAVHAMAWAMVQAMVHHCLNGSGQAVARAKRVPCTAGRLVGRQLRGHQVCVSSTLAAPERQQLAGAGAGVEP